MQMRNEELHGPEWDSKLPEARRARAPAIKHQALRPRFNQDARSKSVRARIRRPGAEQDDPEAGISWWRSMRHAGHLTGRLRRCEEIREEREQEADAHGHSRSRISENRRGKYATAIR